MNPFTTETTVGAIAGGMPLSARIFEQVGIDFCCGGKQTLREACAANGLDAAALMGRIEREALPSIGDAFPVDWQSVPLGDLIDHIVTTHHAYMHAQLPRLQAMLEKIATKHGHNHGDVLRPLAGIFLAMKAELEVHLMKEERILFPLIRQLDGESPSRGDFHCGSVKNPIRVMLMEHDSAGEALVRLRELTNGYTAPEDACNTYRAFYAELADMEHDLHQHIHLENNILFPRAVDLEGRGGESRT